jgi:putative membrane protein
MRRYLINVIQGIAMGVANIIPGVSGGTIALIVGIFERLINSIKSFNIKALRLLLKGQWKTFTEETDFYFLVSIFIGIGVAIISLARLFDFLFKNYPVYIWSYFFGLVLASIYFVAKAIDKWRFSVVFFLIFGTIAAALITFVHPATENAHPGYLFLAGVISICSMILPGLSGSFVLILLGDYHLVAIHAINTMDFAILVPFALGAIAGLVAFSHLLSWVFKRYKDQTIATLTGFILGSMTVLWPWKTAEYLTNSAGQVVVKHGRKVVTHYASTLPAHFGAEVWWAFIIMIIGVLSLTVVEVLAGKKSEDASSS